MPIYQWILISFMLLFALDAAADARRITEYGYDNSGDINTVDTGTSDQPPLVTELLPSTVRIGQQHNVIANGAGLRKVQIDADASDLSISGTSSDSSQATFTLSVGDQVTPGEHTLRFSTPLGFITQAVTVYPPLPTITLNPAPIVLPFPSSPIELDIQLSSEDIIEHTLNLTVDDPAVAELLITSTTIATGQTRPGTTIIITGLQKGVTTLNISSQTLGNYSTRIFVTDPYMPAIGGNTAFTNPLGIILQQTVSPPPLPVRGPFSTELGILKSQSDPVGEISIKPLLSQSLILAKGAVLFNVSHSALIADGSIIEITITGVGLENVDNVEIVPPDGITIGPLTVAPDGTRVSFTVEVDPGVDIGTRKIILTQQGNEILTTRLTAASITIAQGLPAIETIEPIVVSRLSNNALIVRGSHFQTARTLSITPVDGITISSPLSVNAQGTRITANIVIEELAQLGDRVVSVTTNAGSSSQDPSPANTLTVINGPGNKVSLLMAPALAVIKTMDPVADTRDINVRNTRIGIVHGAHIGSLSPEFQPIGADFDLTIHGSGLTDAVSVTFIPDDNISVGIPITADDGLSLTVSVAIDAGAAQTLRQVVVHTQDATITASPVTADRFRVTDLQPQVISLLPNFLVTGNDFITLKIRGQMLNGATAVFAVPEDDIIINSPQVNASGTEITVGIKALSSATTDVRAIVVETAGGESSDIPTPANSLSIIATQPPTFEALVSALLGLEKTTANPPQPTRNLLITSSLMGIVRETTPPETTTTQVQYSNNTGVLLGAAATGTSPRLAPIGSALTLTINGFGLDQVTELSINPSDDLVLTADFSVNTEGTQLTVPINVAGDAELTRREIVLTTATGKLPFVNAEESRLRITGLLPIIESIAPIQQFPGTSPTLVVRGVNLNNTVDIDASPAGGDISFGSISVNAAGTVLQVPMVISASATPGPQVIIITTLAGVTDDRATPANTFTILPLP